MLKIFFEKGVDRVQTPCYDAIVGGVQTPNKNQSNQEANTMKRTYSRNFETVRRSYEIETDQPLYKVVNSESPVGVMGITNCFGIAIFKIEGDECIAAFSNMSGYSNAHRHIIHYSTAGRPYIRKGGYRWYLDNFMAA